MKITSMRSLFVLLLACLLLAGTATAFTNITAADSIYYKEMGGPSCTADASAGPDWREPYRCRGIIRSQ